MIKVIKNALSEKISDNILNILDAPDFPYFFQKYSTYNIGATDLNDYYFSHLIYGDGKTQNSSNEIVQSILMPILNRIEAKKIIRAKINLNTYQKEHVHSLFHIDQEKEHKVAIYYVNTNNGWTEFETGEKINSIKNSILLFDGKLKHKSVTQTDTKMRIVININYS